MELETLAMLISVYEVFEEIQSILKEKNQNQKLQFIDVMLMKNLITLLAPFKSVSTAMEGDKYPMLHGVLLWKKKLLIHCQRKFSDSLAIKCLKSNLALLIEKNGMILIYIKWLYFAFQSLKVYLFYRHP